MINRNLKLRYLRDVLGIQYFLYPDFLDKGKRGRENKHISSHVLPSIKKPLEESLEFSYLNDLNFSISKRGCLSGKWLFLTQGSLTEEDFEVLDRFTRALQAERDFLQILTHWKDFDRTQLNQRNKDRINQNDFRVDQLERKNIFSLLKPFFSFCEFQFGVIFGKTLFNFLMNFSLRSKMDDSNEGQKKDHTVYDLSRLLFFNIPLVVVYDLSELRVKKGQENDVKEVFLRKKITWEKVRNLLLDSKKQNL